MPGAFDLTRPIGMERARPEILYKRLKDGRSPVTHFEWPLPQRNAEAVWVPGDWVEVSLPLALCAHGLHGWLREEDAWDGTDTVYEMEIDGEWTGDSRKVAAQRARLLCPVEYEEEIVERDPRPCQECGEPHVKRRARPGGVASWAHPVDGHAFRALHWEVFARRLLAEKDPVNWPMPPLPATLEEARVAERAAWSYGASSDGYHTHEELRDHRRRLEAEAGA